MISNVPTLPERSRPMPLIPAAVLGAFSVLFGLSAMAIVGGGGAHSDTTLAVASKAAALDTLLNAVAVLLMLASVFCAARIRPLFVGELSDTVAPLAAGVRRLNLVAAITLVAQTLMGALVRFTLAVAEGGAVATADIKGLQTMHAVGSLVTVLLVAAAAGGTIAAAHGRPWLRGLATSVLLLVLAQAGIGLLGGADFRLHVGVGVALLANAWGMTLATRNAIPNTTPRPSAALFRDCIALTKPRVTGLVFFTFAAGFALSPVALSSWTNWLNAAMATWLLVGSANALNMYIERDLDRRMTRTAQRPLPAGRISPEFALVMGTVLVCVSLPMLAVAANGLTALLGFIAWASYVFAYTPLKQISWTSLLVGAVPGAMPPLMGWTAATGSLDAGGLVLFAVLFAWQVPHFIAIGLMRGDEYAKAGHKIITVVKSEIASRRWAWAFALLTVIATLALPLTGVGGWPFAAAVAALGYRFLRSTTQPARPMFLFSLKYLVLVFALLGADRGLSALLRAFP